MRGCMSVRGCISVRGVRTYLSACAPDNFSVDDAGSLLIYELCHIFKWNELKKDAIFVED